MHKPLLAPSLLAADHSRLSDGLTAAEDAGVSWLHIDIMDGHFAPNLSFGPQTVADLRSKSELFFDVHLMLDNPQNFIEAFAEAGAEQISIHVEPEYNIAETLADIDQRGLKKGIVFNPGTPAEELLPYLPQVDLVLAMTVQPGFGGQSFQEPVLQKTAWLDAYRKENNLDFRIQVDGGVGLDNADLCRQHGVDTLVAGTSFFRADDKIGFRSKIESVA